MMTVIALPTGGSLVNIAVNVPAAYSEMTTPEYIDEVIRLWGGA